MKNQPSAAASERRRWAATLIGICLASALGFGQCPPSGIPAMDYIPGIGDFEDNWNTSTGLGYSWEKIGWTADSPVNLSLDPSVAYTGRQSQRFDVFRVGTGPTVNVSLQQKQWLGTPDAVAAVGDTVTVTYYMKTSPVIVGVNTQVWIEYGVGGNIFYHYYRQRAAQLPVLDWTQNSFQWTIPSGCTWFQFKISAGTGSTAATGTVWIDNVSFRNGSPFPAPLCKYVNTFLLYPYSQAAQGLNWVHAMTHYDGGRWEHSDQRYPVYTTTRPDGIQCMFSRVSYVKINNPTVQVGDPYDYNYIAQNHPEWFLKDAQGNYISDGNYRALDIGNPALQDYFLAQYLPYVRAGRFKHVFWDSLDVHSYHNFTDKRPAQYQTDEAWQGAIESFFSRCAETVRAQTGVKVIVNIAHCLPSDDPLKRWLANSIDGYMIELGFIVINGNGSRRVAYFSSWWIKFMSLWNMPLDRIIIVRTDGGDITSDRRYGLASFLAAMKPNGYLAMCRKGEVTLWHNELTVDIGAPIGDFTVIGGSLDWDRQSPELTNYGCLVKRLFANGMVLVNSHDSQPFSTVLQGTYRDMDGNQVTGPVTLQRETALILLGPNPPDSTPPTIVPTSPVPESTVRGIINISANVTDTSGIARVEVHVDDSLVASKFDAPYVFPWDSKSVENGDHTIVIKAFDGHNNVATSEMVNITTANDFVAPTSEITEPANNSTVAGIVEIRANATDNQRVKRVDFYFDDRLIPSGITTPPYMVGWETRAWDEGEHILTARAYDDSDNIGVSAPVRVIVNNTPTIAVTNPSNGATVGGPVNIRANVTYSTSPISKVEFFVDGVLRGTDTSTPFSINWDSLNVSNGTRTLTAKATDTFNHSAVSPPITVTVQNLTTSLTSPASGSVLSGQVELTAIAPSATAVTKVEFYDGATLIATDTSTPYSVVWDTREAANGSHNLTARGYDSTHSVTSAAVPVTVANSAMNGQVTFDHAIPTAGLRVFIEWRNPGSHVQVWGKPVFLDAQGRFTCRMTPGWYDITAKLANSLRGKLANVDLTSGQSIIFALTLGDTNDDNIIDDADLTGAILDYGGPPANGATDVNYDGMVDDADLTIVVLGYGQAGAD